MDTAPTISIYSTIAVFSMCLTSIYKHSQKGFTFNWKILGSLSLGSLLDGILGEAIFKEIKVTLSNQKVTLIQSTLLFGVLFLALLFTRLHQNLPKYQLTHPILIFGLGGLVGSLSVFLGIGGGPLNIIVLMGFLAFSSKESIPYSLAMIFFAQIPKILNLLFNTQEVTYNL